MSERYPLYPDLTEAGGEEAQALIDRFKKQMKDVMEEALGAMYSDVACHIQSASWTNFRNALMQGFQNYRNRHVQGEYDFKVIREKIYSEFRAEIINDLDQNNLKRIDDLNKEISRLREIIDRRPHGMSGA